MYKKSILPVMLLLMSSTAFTQKKYEMGNPNDEANYGYLKDYAPLKNYIDTEKYPNFKLGIGTTVNDYLNNSNVKGFTNDNFTETVAGNAMKMASCVGSDGSMNFTQVKNYVNAATKAGLAVYGHTLAWHAQQPNAWLNSLIKDIPAEPFENPDTMVYVTVKSKDFRTEQSVGWTADKTQYGFSINYSATDGLHLKTTKKVNSWEVQFVAFDGIPMEKGKTYKVTITAKGSSQGKLYTKLGDWGQGVNVNTTFTTEWKDIELIYKNSTAGSFLLLQCGDFVGDLYIKSIKMEEPVGAMKINEPRRYISVETTAKSSDVWDNQFWIVSPSTFAKGAKYEFSADVRADKNAKASTQIHTSPGSYVDYQAIGDIQFTTEWKTVKVSGTLAAAGQSIAFNLSELAEANTYYFDNVSFKVNGVEKMKNGTFDDTDLSTFKMRKLGGGTIAPTIKEEAFYIQLPQSTPLTAQQKRDTLVWAMDKWIKGMMEACDGKVKSWDVVNEAISGGGDDGSGNYTLQHANGSNDFFWQDHMGDLEYVRSAIRSARKYGPEDIKLFINDYNLESDWDGNKKLKSLINWIKKWEADGETYVDGIGTQMHISYYANSSTQKSKENAIVHMFKLMANSGKLVRVSELDMGYNDASGNSVSTSKMTEAMHHKMADFYEWIVKKYLEIIPPAQQAGICFWCPTDSPTNSGWRADTPVGIWTLDYYRKHAYAGIAEGLGGVNIAGIEDITCDEVTADKARTFNGIYTITGVRLPEETIFSELPHGIYIINGKKVVK
ncbi:MAG: endo-1,4-beta-xylanase [Bacteroidaceae bacterium]|nr:endo-1,4-beta-xylanase [Bacteroidaceae bacterium]